MGRGAGAAVDRDRGVPGLDHGAGAQRGRPVDPLPVDQGAVAGAEVLDQPGVAGTVEAGVVARHGRSYTGSSADMERPKTTGFSSRRRSKARPSGGVTRRTSTTLPSSSGRGKRTGAPGYSRSQARRRGEPRRRRGEHRSLLPPAGQRVPELPRPAGDHPDLDHPGGGRLSEHEALPVRQQVEAATPEVEPRSTSSGRPTVGSLPAPSNSTAITRRKWLK